MSSIKHFTNLWFRKCLAIQFLPASGSYRNLICSSDFASKNSRQLSRNPTTNLLTPIAPRLPKHQIPWIQRKVAFYGKTSNIPCPILSNHSKNGFRPNFLLRYHNLMQSKAVNHLNPGSSISGPFLDQFYHLAHTNYIWELFRSKNPDFTSLPLS